MKTLNSERGGASKIKEIDNISAVSTAKHERGKSAFPLDADNRLRVVFVFHVFVLGVIELGLWCVLNPVIE
jgi:hypothetical protein